MKARCARARILKDFQFQIQAEWRERVCVTIQQVHTK